MMMIIIIIIPANVDCGVKVSDNMLGNFCVLSH